MSVAMPRKLSHLDAKGRIRMVDVGDKPVTTRTAIARGRVFMHRDTLALLKDGRAPKGDVLTTAHLAGVMAAKRTAEIIPLAHTIPLVGLEIAFSLDTDSASVGIEARARARGQTGVEMEALTAVTVAALTLYDMLKAVDRGMVMGEFAVWEKRGGRSGVFRRRS
jgi:cyclic pyranopterin phosphate synthase